MNRWLREPLLHFIVAGVGLFLAYSLVQDTDPSVDSQTIVVDRRALLTFLQYRANAFDPDTFGTILDSMSDAELNDIIHSYVDEEILYREALDLELESSDNIIRQRMIQKMTFLLADISATGEAADEQTLQDFFDANIDSYAVAPWATFTHVFFDAATRGADGALAAALEARQSLNQRGAQFNDAPGVGDRFPFLRNYVERTLAYVASHFGEGFAARIEASEPSAIDWLGPFESVYGQHVVLLTDRADRSYPDLDEVRSAVERDLAAESSSIALDELTDSLRERYTVRVTDIRSATTP